MPHVVDKQAAPALPKDIRSAIFNPQERAVATVDEEKPTLEMEVEVIDGRTHLILPAEWPVEALRRPAKETSRTCYFTLTAEAIQVNVTGTDEAGDAQERIMTTKPVTLNMFLRIA